MGLISRLFGRVAPEQRRSNMIGTVGFGMTGAATVNAHLAENLSAVLACVGAISSTIATLPAFVYLKQDGGRTEAPNHPVSRLIRGPNTRQTWPDWVEWTLAQTLLHGNSISIIEYDGAGRVTNLLPVPWPNVLVSLLPSGRLAYDVMQYIAPWGGSGQPRRYMDDEVFHLRDRSDDGFLGRSRLSRSPEVMGQAFNLQSYMASVWRNGAMPSGALTHPGHLSSEAKTYLGESFGETYNGTTNAKRTLVLEEGMTWLPFSISPEDAEVLASRRFTVEELCRIFQVPPPIIQDYSHGTFTNTQQAALWFAQLSLTPWVRKIEAEFARTVFGDGSDYHLEIDLSGLMRGDYAARWSAYGTAIDKGILTVDEIREAEGYNPIGSAPNAAEGASTA